MRPDLREAALFSWMAYPAPILSAKRINLERGSLTLRKVTLHFQSEQGFFRNFQFERALAW
jgi:hypothetical protein